MTGNTTIEISDNLIELGIDRELVDLLEKEDLTLSYITFKMIMEHDLAAWTKLYNKKTDTFRMLFVNHMYEKTFGIVNQEYSGLNDIDIWPDETSLEFEQNDRRVLRNRGVAIPTIEFIDNAVTGTKQKLIGYKWGPTHTTANIIPVFGIVTSIEDLT